MTRNASHIGHGIPLGGNIEWERAPIRHVHGHLNSALTVSDNLHVVGSILDSALITPGCALFLEGLMAGHLDVQMQGRFELEGRFAALVGSNEGQITLWGIIETPTALLPGSVRVRVGSAIIRDGKTLVLQEDGSLIDDPLFDLDMLTTPGLPLDLMPDGMTFQSRGTLSRREIRSRHAARRTPDVGEPPVS